MAIKKLPSTKSGGNYDFQELAHLYYGAPGVGKTTFAANLPKKNLFISTEDGQRALSVYNQPVNTWEDFKDIVSLVEAGQGDMYHSLTVDTVDNLFMFCETYVCKKLRITHMADENFGKGWAALKTEFKKEVTKLQNTGIGVIFISHAKEVEIKTRVLKLNKWIPSFSKQCRDVLIPIVDEMFYFYIEDKIEKGKAITERRIACHPGESWEAKDRIGCFPETMPMNVKEVLKIYNKRSKV